MGITGCYGGKIDCTYPRCKCTPPKESEQRDEKGRPMTYWGGLASSKEKEQRIDHETLESNADKVDRALQEYLSDYEFRGDEGCHTPTDVERLLIEDAIQGLMVEQEFVEAFVAMHTQAAQSARQHIHPDELENVLDRWLRGSFGNDVLEKKLRGIIEDARRSLASTAKKENKDA